MSFIKKWAAPVILSNAFTAYAMYAYYTNTFEEYIADLNESYAKNVEDIRDFEAELSSQATMNYSNLWYHSATLRGEVGKLSCSLVEAQRKIVVYQNALNEMTDESAAETLYHLNGKLEDHCSTTPTIRYDSNIIN